MQIKPNFQDDKNDANSVLTKVYEENADFRHEKTNPIQTQFQMIRWLFQQAYCNCTDNQIYWSLYNELERSMLDIN